jgi:hypothetical protein
MEFKKKLLEARATDPEVMEFVESCRNHLFFKQFVKNYKKHLAEQKALKEAGALGHEPESGALSGQTEDDSEQLGLRVAGTTVGASTDLQVYATLEIFNAVIRGFTRYMDDSFVRKYVTESVQFKIPLVEYQELVAGISAGELPHTEKTIDYATVDLSTPESEKGGKVTWTRALLEDVTFDVQAEMAEGLGHAIAKKMMGDILYTLMGVTKGNTPFGSCYTLSDPIEWSEFLAVISYVDIGIAATDDPDTGHNNRITYGPADYALVSTKIYWQLLNIIQMTNVLYEGSTDPIKSGKVSLALGVTISKQSLLPDGTMIALNSEKAIALVTRRQLKIEPVLFPVWNEYGFIGTVRYGVTLLFEGAIQHAAVGGAIGTGES